MTVVYYNQKGCHLDTAEKFCICKETIQGNQLDDKPTVVHNKIFCVMLKRESQFANAAPL